MRIAAALIWIVLVCALGFAQATDDPSCPSFSISMPSPPRFDGELYILRLEGPDSFDWSTVFLEWSVSPRRKLTEISPQEISFIWRGAGESGSITAIVKIKGLREGCPTTVSQTMSWDAAPKPRKVGRWKIGQPLSTLSQFAADIAINADHSAITYIVRSPKSTNSSYQELKDVLIQFSPSQGAIYSPRITIIDAEGPEELVEIWLVPPGADNPQCESCQKPECPEMSITGPVGIVEPGNIARYELHVAPYDRKKLRIEWSTTAGKFESGQGTRKIAVRTAKDSGLSFVVTAKVSGLPEGCPGTLSEAAAVAS